jgi:uncharacterized protein
MGVPRAASRNQGRLAENIVHFARALRKAGVRVGPAQVQSAVEAVAAAGFTHKTDFYHTLRATLIHRAEHLEVFDQIFAMFWRDPEFIEHMIHLMSPTLRKDAEERKKKAAERRAADALTDAERRPRHPRARGADDGRADQLVRVRTAPRDGLRADERGRDPEAARAVRALSLPVKPVPTRRSIASPAGRGPTCAPRCAGRCGAAARSSGSRCASAGPGPPTSWRSATSRGRCRSIPGC